MNYVKEIPVVSIWTLEQGSSRTTEKIMHSFILRTLHQISVARLKKMRQERLARLVNLEILAGKQEGDTPIG
jgi:hypothetical protein